MATITIAELESTWGCAWIGPNGERRYSWKDAPVAPRTRTWLDAADGDAVTNLLKGGLGTVVSTARSAYGDSQCRTIQVEIDALDTACATFWDRMNARKHPTTCHYCGQKATRRGFFGEPVCNECS